MLNVDYILPGNGQVNLHKLVTGHPVIIILGEGVNVDMRRLSFLPLVFPVLFLPLPELTAQIDSATAQLRN